MDFIGKAGRWPVDIEPFKIVVVLWICIFLFYKYISHQFRRDPRLMAFAATLPGPPTVPILGNGLDFFLGGPDALYKIMKYSEKYGPIYRLWFGKHLVVGLTDVNDLEVVFGSSKMMGKPELFRPFQDIFGDGLFTGPMHIWKKNRKLFQPTLNNNMLSYYVPEFNEKIYATIDQMKNLIDGPVFDAWDYLPYLSFDIISKTALDVELDSHDKTVLQFHDHVKKGMESSFLRMFRPWLHVKFICDFFWGSKITLARSSMLKFSEQMMATKVDELKHEAANRSYEHDIDESELSLKSFLRLAYQLGVQTNDEKLMHDELITMLTGGTDTTAITNSFFLLAVAMYPDVQEKLYDELYEIFGDGDRPADHDDLARLPYLDQVLKEVMRRFTLVPVIFREVEEDAKIGSRIFPAGTALMISTIGIHFNPEYYPNPWAFNPENFAPDTADKRHKLTFLPFSTGPRNCIGQNYAIVEMKLTQIALLRTFSFHTTVKIEDVKMSMGFLMTSSDGYKISVRQRDRRPSYIRN